MVHREITDGSVLKVVSSSREASEKRENIESPISEPARRNDQITQEER
jgi:hypothetical protein